jgi:hypothetical protein
MKRSTMTLLQLLALLAIGALPVSTASAAEGVLPLSHKGFTMLSARAMFESTTAGTSIECNELKSTEGVFENDTRGHVRLDFDSCEQLGFPVHSLGESIPKTIKEGLILAKALLSLCLINSAELKFGVFVELTEPVHMETEAFGVLFVMSGGVIASIANSKGKLLRVEFLGLAGKPTVTECKDELGGVKKHSLTISTNGEKAASASLNDLSALFQFEEEMELMDK